MITSIELQKALYSKLSGKYSVYDALPNDGAMPYILIGEEILQDRKTKTENRSEHVITFHCWSNKTSSLECMTMMDEVRNIDESLVVNGHKVERVRLDNSQLTKTLEGDSMYRHGVIYLSFTLEKK